MLSSVNTEAVVLKEGFMEISRTNGTSYDRLWIVLYSDNSLMYTDNPGNSTSDLSKIKTTERKSSTTFEVVTLEKVSTFRCQNEDECDEWFAIILSLEDHDIANEVMMSPDGHETKQKTQHIDQRPFSNRMDAISDRNQIDLSIFKDVSSHCARHSDEVPITESCEHTKRLCTASRYFHILSTSTTFNEEDKMNLFMEFNHEVYQLMLDDIIHFVKEHKNDIKRVHFEWTELYRLPKCSISHCAQTVRHYGREKRQKEIEILESNASHEFYESAYDRIHNFIFHLFDIGMRVDPSSLTLSEDDEVENQTNLVGVAVDKWFTAERKSIRLRREECKLDFDRFEGANNKYTMQMMSEKENGITLMHAMFQKLSEVTNAKRETLRRIRGYFEENSFESECIEMDIEDVADSNISNFLQNQATVQIMADFLKSAKCMLNLCCACSHPQ